METMRARTFIHDRLAADSTLMGLIGSRLYHAGNVPANTPFPYVEYKAYADTPSIALDGTVYGSRVRLQVKTYGQNVPDATLEAIMDRIRVLLDRQKGTVTNGTVLTCNYLGSPPLPAEVNGAVTYIPLLSEYLIYVQQTVFA